MKRNKKKLLFICSSLRGGGAEKVLVYLMNQIDKKKYAARLVLFERELDYLKELDPAVEIDCFDKASRWDFLKMIFKLRKRLRDYKPDVIISFLYYTNIVTVMAVLLARVKCRLLICEHSYLQKYFAEVKFGGLKEMLIKITYKKADKIIVVSKNIKKYIVENYGFSSKHIEVIYNPIPLSEIIVKCHEKVDHRFLNKENIKVIIAVGRLARVKRYDRLIRAFSGARKKQKNLRLLFLGKGELETELKLLAEQVDEEKYIDFVGFKSNPYAWISKADVLALSSEREGFPNVLIEAMACGVPVVSTDCLSGPNEIIENNQNGILVPEKDEGLMAEALLTATVNVELRKKFIEAGKIFSENFKVENILPRYEALF